MEFLLNLLPQMLARAGDSDEARQQTVFAGWAAVAGPHLRRATSPVRLERKTLIIATLDSTWRAQLHRMRGQLVFRLGSALGSPLVTAIEFVINSKLVNSAHTIRAPIQFSAPEQQVRDLMDRVVGLSNLEIRDTFLRAAGKCLERRTGALANDHNNT